MLILLVILIVERVLLGLFSLKVVQLYHGLQIYGRFITLSTTEVEYVAASEAGNEMIWLHGFLD